MSSSTGPEGGSAARPRRLVLHFDINKASASFYVTGGNLLTGNTSTMDLYHRQLS